MYVLVTYDVFTGDAGGPRRLRQVAKLCERYGQRVQYSTFECLITPADYANLKHEIERVIDCDHDGVRFYNLGKHWDSRVESVGRNTAYNPEGTLCI